MNINEIINIKDFYIVIIGMRGSGKSIIIRDILNKCLNLYPAKISISKTERLNKFYHDLMDDKFIYDDYNNSILNRVFERQKLLIENNKNHNTAIIFDDCLSSNGKWTKEPQIINLFDNKKEHKLTAIFTFQFALGISNAMKDCFDYVFLLHEDFISNRKRLYEHYGHYVFETFEEFQDKFLEITPNFGCMVININKKEYYPYKAELNNIDNDSSSSI